MKRRPGGFFFSCSLQITFSTCVSLHLGGSAGISREAFVREDLQRWGLCGPLGESAPDARWSAFGGVAARRRLVGEYLGVGDCDAKQLLRQMNLFFSTDEARRRCLVPVNTHWVSTR